MKKLLLLCLFTFALTAMTTEDSQKKHYEWANSIIERFFEQARSNFFIPSAGKPYVKLSRLPLEIEKKEATERGIILEMTGNLFSLHLPVGTWNFAKIETKANNGPESLLQAVLTTLDVREINDISGFELAKRLYRIKRIGTAEDADKLPHPEFKKPSSGSSK